jgi:hypothetical protein
MVKLYRPAGPGNFRREGLVDLCRRSEHLKTHLRRPGRHSGDAAVEFKHVNLPGRGADRLRQDVALRIAAVIEGRGIHPARRAFGKDRDFSVTGNDPVCDGASNTVRSSFKISILNQVHGTGRQVSPNLAGQDERYQESSRKAEYPSAAMVAAAEDAGEQILAGKVQFHSWRL